MTWDNLIGLPFRAGDHDCFGLVRSFFKQNFDISITNYARPSDWSSDNLDLMAVCAEREGFEKITHWTANDLRPGDVFALAIGSSAPNHFAVFVGDNTLIHHLFGRMSNSELYRDFWRSMTSFLLRHPEVPDLRPVYPDVEIGELLRARLDFVPKS